MQRTDETEEARKAKRREQQRRWRERNREKVREANRRWKANNRDKVREANRRWRKANPDKVRANWQNWRENNRERSRENKRRWRENGGYRRYYWKYRERCLARVRAYRERLRQHWPAFGELQKAALLANGTYAAVHRAVPANLPGWLRDDVISEVVLLILEGRAALESAAAEVKAALRRHRAAFYRELSLNVPAIEGGLDRIDFLRAEDFEGAEE